MLALPKILGWGHYSTDDAVPQTASCSLLALGVNWEACHTDWYVLLLHNGLAICCYPVPG